jgi:hypothetical protein
MAVPTATDNAARCVDVLVADVAHDASDCSGSYLLHVLYCISFKYIAQVQAVTWIMLIAYGPLQSANDVESAEVSWVTGVIVHSNDFHFCRWS